MRMIGADPLVLTVIIPGKGGVLNRQSPVYTHTPDGAYKGIPAGKRLGTQNEPGDHFIGIGVDLVHDLGKFPAFFGGPFSKPEL
jgi:hypothetical protein